MERNGRNGKEYVETCGVCHEVKDMNENFMEEAGSKIIQRLMEIGCWI